MNIRTKLIDSFLLWILFHTRRSFQASVNKCIKTDGLSNFLGKNTAVFGHLSTLLHTAEKKYEGNKEQLKLPDKNNNIKGTYINYQDTI